MENGNVPPPIWGPPIVISMTGGEDGLPPVWTVPCGEGSHSDLH